MAVYTLTQASPEGAPFTLAASAEVNISLLGGSETDTKSKVVLELDKGGSDFASYLKRERRLSFVAQ